MITKNKRFATDSLDPKFVELMYEVAARTEEWRKGLIRLHEVDAALDRLREYESERNGE